MIKKFVCFMGTKATDITVGQCLIFSLICMAPMVIPFVYWHVKEKIEEHLSDRRKEVDA